MIVIDKEFQELIPPLTDDEYDRLEKSILEEGVRDPIITWNGTIIDGHNRYNICQEHDIEFKTTEHDFESRDAAKIWIIENQFGRRNLSTYDRSVLALQLEPLYAAEAKRRQQEHGNTAPGKSKSLRQKSDEVIAPIRTDEQLAKLAGTSRDTIRKVKVIETEAAKGNETAVEAKKAVKSGEKSIHKAYTEVRNNGDKSDVRPLCTVCGKPINDGESYSHDKFKHRSCASRLNEQSRVNGHGESASEERRFCSICGKPIEDGDRFRDSYNWCKKCGYEHELERERKRRERKRLENNITIGDVNEVIEHDKPELKRQLLLDVRTAWSNLQATLTRYESMGVTITEEESSRIRDAVDSLASTIDSINCEKEE